MTAVRNAIKRGDPVEEIESFVGGDLLERVCSQWLGENSPDGFMTRCQSVLQHYAIGRAGEAEYVNLATAKWEDTLALSWSETKRAKAKLIRFYPHATSMVMDVFHAMACHFMFTARLAEHDEKSAFMFPTLYKSADGAIAARVTRKMRALVGKVPGLHCGHASHGIRAGTYAKRTQTNLSLTI